MRPRNFNYGPDSAVEILQRLVPRVSYKPGWSFELHEIDRGQGCGGLTLCIGATVPNSVSPGEDTKILHLMPVLPAAYDEESWMLWIFEQIEMVEHHEAMEFFRVDGEAPYFSEHAPGRNPYALRLVKTPEQRDAEAVPWVGGAPSFDPGAVA
jgi:hypothetical protein